MCDRQGSAERRLQLITVRVKCWFECSRRSPGWSSARDADSEGGVDMHNAAWCKVIKWVLIAFIDRASRAFTYIYNAQSFNTWTGAKKGNKLWKNRVEWVHLMKVLTQMILGMSLQPFSHSSLLMRALTFFYKTAYNFQTINATNLLLYYHKYESEG